MLSESQVIHELVLAIRIKETKGKPQAGRRSGKLKGKLKKTQTVGLSSSFKVNGTYLIFKKKYYIIII